MLRTLIIISSTSGIVLFTKVFVKDVEKPTMSAAVVTAFQKLAVLKTGLPVTFIQLTKVGVAIITSAKVTCVLLMDASDGVELPKILAREILDAFVSSFQPELEEKGGASNPDVFLPFSTRIAECVSSSMRPVLDALQETRGIKLALLTNNDTLKHSTQDVDRLSVLANHQALINVASDIMATQNDTVGNVTLKARQTAVFLQRLDRWSLVIVRSTKYEDASYTPHIERAIRLLRALLAINSNLQDPTAAATLR